MTLTIDDVRLDRPLTKAEEQRVRQYVETIIAESPRPEASRSMSREQIDAITAIFRRLGDEKNGVELAHEANDIRVAADAE